MERLLGGLPNRGPDLRLISGYVTSRSRILGSEWFDTWIEAEMQRDPDDLQLLFEIAARTNPTSRCVQLLEVALRTHKVDPIKVGFLAYGDWSLASRDVLTSLLTAIADNGTEETAVTILAQRFRTKPEEINDWEGFATRLATLPKLIRSRQMTGFYWAAVARTVAPKHVAELARAICAAHAERTDSWMVEFSDAKKLILELVELDPSSVWQALKSHLTSRAESLMFTIGFPRDVIDRVPPNEVVSWVAEDPQERGSIVAHLANKDFSNDETLASQVVGRFGNLKYVASSFFSNLIGGVFGGPASAHWERLSQQLIAVGKRTQLPKLGLWAEEAALSLHTMSENERQREDEEQLRSS